MIESLGFKRRCCKGLLDMQRTALCSKLLLCSARRTESYSEKNEGGQAQGFKLEIMQMKTSIWAALYGCSVLIILGFPLKPTEGTAWFNLYAACSWQSESPPAGPHHTAAVCVQMGSTPAQKRRSAAQRRGAPGTSSSPKSIISSASSTGPSSAAASAARHSAMGSRCSRSGRSADDAKSACSSGARKAVKAGRSSRFSMLRCGAGRGFTRLGFKVCSFEAENPKPEDTGRRIPNNYI